MSTPIRKPDELRLRLIMHVLKIMNYLEVVFNALSKESHLGIDASSPSFSAPSV